VRSADDGAWPDPSLPQGREHFERREWRAAVEALAAVAPDRLPAADGERLAVAAWLVGDDDRSDDAWARAAEAHVAAGDPLDAARCAFWLGLNLLLRGDGARSSGWLARARTLSRDTDASAVAGLLLVVEGLALLGADPAASFGIFDRAREVGEVCGDADVLALARLGRGQALIAQSRIAAGTASLDEAMVAVLADEVSPTVAGIVYCAVLLECRNTFDARRAQEWTGALTRWCETQPDLVAYRGQCLVHRSEILQFEGRWNDALEEARRACERLAGQPAIGEAYYQQAQMHRLRGEYAEAEAAYRAAGEFGRDPQPGLALLRLAQGNTDAALASIRRVGAEQQAPGDRCRTLAAAAEVALARDDRETARAAADELDAIATAVDAPMLAADAQRVRGAVLLADGDATGATAALRGSLRIWLELGAPYEAARVRVLLARASHVLGDDDSARLELDVARATFQELGAAPDLAGLDRESSAAASGATAGLTLRELEVLRLVTTGRTNHEIALELVVSDHTVRRHLQNIFAKIGVSSRAAATAFAFEHGIV
jgi:DNA-binding CsgD family transcriptional regulator